MGNMITFANDTTFNVLSIAGRNEMTSSDVDLLTDSKRNILEIKFDGSVYDTETLLYYYENTDNAERITITDDGGNTYVYIDYVIPVKFSTEYNGTETKTIVLVLAQLTEADKALREATNVTGYTGTELEITQKRKIAESKQMLVDWLENNPLLYIDGAYYSVTEEKQSLLNNNLASYERAKAIGVEYPLKWNNTGNECTEWEYENLLALSLAIAEYVAPQVSRQQSYELSIKACTTVSDVNKIDILYGIVDDEIVDNNKDFDDANLTENDESEEIEDNSAENELSEV